MSIILRGRTINKGYTEGEALICHEPIGFNFGFDVQTGAVIEHGHELEGISIKDKILVFPSGKGSTGGSYAIYQLAKNNTGPKAIINLSTEAIIAVGAIMGGIPVVDHLDQNPLEVIKDGDMVKVNATEGLVEIIKSS